MGDRKRWVDKGERGREGVPTCTVPVSMASEMAMAWFTSRVNTQP